VPALPDAKQVADATLMQELSVQPDTCMRTVPLPPVQFTVIPSARVAVPPLAGLVKVAVDGIVIVP